MLERSDACPQYRLARQSIEDLFDLVVVEIHRFFRHLLTSRRGPASRPAWGLNVEPVDPGERDDNAVGVAERRLMLAVCQEVKGHAGARFAVFVRAASVENGVGGLSIR